MPDINMAITTRGPAGAAHLALFTFIDQFPSFDNFVANAAEHVRAWYFDHESWMRKGGHPDLEFYFFGWSEKRTRPEGYLIRCGYADSACYRDQKSGAKAGRKYRNKPFIVQELSDFCCAPGIFQMSDLAAAKFPVNLKPKDLTPEIDLLHIMEMLRRTPDARFPGDKKAIFIGGHATLTCIDADGVTQKTLATWPDAIGEPILVSAPLDWQRWRDGQMFRHRLRTPTSDNKRKQLERKNETCR
jgi:hypothetical protein